MNIVRIPVRYVVDGKPNHDASPEDVSKELIVNLEQFVTMQPYPHSKSGLILLKIYYTFDYTDDIFVTRETYEALIEHFGKIGDNGSFFKDLTK